jgi:hypothetical protein
MRDHLTTLFYGLKDRKAFLDALRAALVQVAWKNSYTGDNLITFGKNLSFLDDEKFMAAVGRHATDLVEQGILWRTHVLAWAARGGLRHEGDFVECCCYKGTSAAVLCDYLDFSTLPKTFYLYDSFDVRVTDTVSDAKTDHGPELFERTKQRFAAIPNVKVLRGMVPAVLDDESPSRIAFLHIDMNNAAGEIAALERLFDRVVPGGLVVLDDYGYTIFRAQKLAHDKFFGSRGYSVVELPTSQGLVVK